MPKVGHVPYFYVKCQSSMYFGTNPYNFTPSFLPGKFPCNGSMVNDKFVRSYVCDGITLNVIGNLVPYALPSWKMMGFFPIDDASCALLSTNTYAESVCNPDLTSSPTSKPLTSSPNSKPTFDPNPTSIPTSKPTSCIALDQNY